MMLVAGAERHRRATCAIARPEHAGARAGGRGDRGHGVVPPGHARRRRHRRGAGAGRLQLPRQARAHRPAPVRRGARRGGVAEPRAVAARRRRRSRSRPKVAADPRRNCASVWWVRRLNVARRSVVLVVVAVAGAAGHHRTVAPPALRDHRRASRSARCRSPCSPAGRASSRSARWRSPGSARSLAAALTRGLHVDVGVVDHRRRARLPFVLSIVLAALVTAGLAAVIGVGALRVRGLLLAVSTFAFARRRAAVPLPPARVLGRRVRRWCRSRAARCSGLDLSSQRTYYYVVLAVLVDRGRVVSRLRRTGRRPHDDRGARQRRQRRAAYTVGVAPTKLRAFALAGGIAGLGGALLAGAVETVPFTERYFLVGDSLALVVARGDRRDRVADRARCSARCGSSGCRRSSPTTSWCRCFTSSLGLLVLLLYFPGGFVQIAYAARDALLAWAAAAGAGAPTDAPRHDAARPRCGGRDPTLAGRRPGARGRRHRSAVRRRRRRRRRVAAASARTRSSGSSAPTAPASRR